MHSSRMRTARFSGRLGGVCPGGVCLFGVCHPPPPVGRQTPVKTLPCPKLRLRALIKIAWTLTDRDTTENQSKLLRKVYI